MTTLDVVATDIQYSEDALHANPRMRAFEAAASATETEASETSSLELGGCPVLSFQYRVVKPVLNLTLVFLSLPVVLPLSLLIAVLVCLTSRGPVLYRHRRIGQFGRPVYIWKFRTMYQGSDYILEAHLQNDPKAYAEWANSQKLKSDPRVTRIGRLLRKASLDEIPQLINVLAGNMSLVGPRPIVSAERQRYGAYFRYYAYAVPGITGLWQVSGRSNLSYDQRVQLDVEYVRHWTLWMEIKIIFKTFRVLLCGRGAY